MKNCVNHPDRKHVAKSLCSSCYNKAYRSSKCNDPKFRLRERLRDKARWASKSKSSKLDYVYKANYGLSYQDVHNMWMAQDKKCASCKDLVNLGHNKGVVDHCHTTGKVRSILCHPCNVALGFLREDEDRILNLLGYLRTHTNGAA